MFLHIKVYFVGFIYFLGVLFMILFPPRNFEQSGTKMRRVRSIGNVLKYKKYIDYETMLDVVQHMTTEDPEMVDVVNLRPNTAANNSLIALELHSDVHSKKPGILVIGTINGMVWGGSNTVLELAEKLLYDTNYQTPFFNDYDWYLIPIANPDALNFTTSLREYTSVDATEWSRNVSARSKTKPSEWHKNIDEETGGQQCFGTNINRNFAYHWQDDVYKTPALCSQYYPGAKPFSTAEARAIRKYVHNLADIVHLAIHLHASFVPKKEFILYPWRYTSRQPSNFQTLQEIGEYAARQARLPDGRLYEVHQGSSDARVAGSLSDYISGVIGTDLVFVVKPYHEKFPNYTDTVSLETYVQKSISAILSLVRGWRSNTKQNTLSFFGKDVEF
ncbi:metallocarboxypeptidase A-like protein ARB_03789 [Melitaea cinxia]|uniref:metallocarboxypeptidase A-like protein ARB_03789 n=1 Tax=Melitaea cinxia TaxID=113334 RepID=UPI001E272994|nr:metallocarboxypeptidase A-like protein ARB_03789 [Melitaea cinxia]